MGYAGFLIAGSFAYISASMRLEAALFDNIMSKEATLVHARLTRKYYLLSGYSILGQGLFALLIGIMHWPYLLWVSLGLMITHLILFEYFLLHSIKPHYVKAMDEYQDELDKSNN